MDKRPQLKLTLSTSDKTIEVMGWLLLVTLWVLIVWSYNNLPSTIATHFNVAGQADAYGSKTSLFTLPIIGTIIFVVITILNNYPHIFNYPTPINPNNALAQYTNATRMLRYLKCIVLLIFLSITMLTIKVASTKGMGLGFWFLPISIGAIFIPLTFFIIKAFKRK